MGLRNTVRPKHQVLILKCYPRFQKSTAEVKPNSSELSYLLYYASTRRSKLSKLGAYLEKRSESDVRRGRLGNIQVTLHILTAIIEKCTKDLALFAPFVLSILSMVLASGDINFIEESVPTFGALCSHMDQTTFASDHADLNQYDNIIVTYAGIATKSTQTSGRGNQGNSVAETLRFRTAGLNAIKSLVSSDSFGSYSDQLRVVMPAILEQLISDDPKYLRRLQARENASERLERDQMLKRRQSLGARRSTDIPRISEPPETDPAAVTGSTADIDQRATEEVGVLAIQSLRKIFNTENRGQVRVATTVTLAFALNHTTRVTETASNEMPQGSWQSSASVADLFEAICRWTAVQDRFVILVTTMESLISSPLEETDLQRQLVLSEAVTRLLRSDINFIGLSVMDVLIGLIQHVLLLLQISGKGSSFAPGQQSRESLARTILSNGAAEKSEPSSRDIASKPFLKKPSALRIQLLEQLQQCVADLAMHVYYIDQVGDMISALLLRLKPGASSISSPIAAVENPEAAVNDIAESVNLQEKPHADGFFSFETARVIALQCVNEILIVANSTRRDNGSADIRNRVDVAVWEGTQWLLRDPDPSVRRAYVESLLTWLDLEVDRKGIRLAEESIQDTKSKITRMSIGPNDSRPKRGVSNASKRKKATAKAHTSFMQLLHLAIYEHAMTFADSETEILPLHLLLATLVAKLGVNSVRSGLSMIYQLQEDAQRLANSSAVILVTSLAHGYFMVLSRHFDFEHTLLGRQIQNEQSRRATQGLWAKGITVPPALLVGPGIASMSTPALGSALGTHPTELLEFIGSRSEMVDAISEGYSQDIISPPQSPAMSPGKPTHRMRSLRSSVNSQAPLVHDCVLPAAVKAEMLEPWSREACIKAAELDRSRTLSITASKSGSGSGHHSRISPDGRAPNGSILRDSMPNFRASAYGNPILNSVRASHYGSFPGRRYISGGSVRTPASNSSVRSVVRVDDLKRALSGAAYNPESNDQNDGNNDTNSDSMVSADLTVSEVSLVKEDRNGHPTTHGAREPIREADALHRGSPPQDDDVPPVPMLPANLRLSPKSVEEAVSPKSNEDDEFASTRPASTYGAVIPGKIDLQALLAESGSISKRASVTSTPPY